MENKSLFIRGARIIQQLDETTYAQLQRDTNNFVPPTTKRQHATGPIHIVKMELVPYVNTTDLMAKAIANSVESKTQYHPQILFLSATYEDSDQPDNVSFVGTDNQEHYVEPIQLARSNVKVRCDCLDFYYRFSTVNFRSDALYGKPRPNYHKKTNRPDANPRHTPGVCKHLIKMVEELQRTGMVRL